MGCASILRRPQRDHKIRPRSKGSDAAYEVTRAAPEVGCDLQNDDVRVLWDVVLRAMREEIWADRILEPDICVDQLATPAKLLMELPSPGVREDTRDLFLVASVSALGTVDQSIKVCLQRTEPAAGAATCSWAQPKNDDA